MHNSETLLLFKAGMTLILVKAMVQFTLQLVTRKNVEPRIVFDIVDIAAILTLGAMIIYGWRLS
jgi:predicted PurR-regulated permease PerM